MLSGSVLGTAVLIDGMVQRIEEELGSPATLVVTGGLAKYVTPLCRHPLTYDPELLMKGLALLYQLNARRSTAAAMAAAGITVSRDASGQSTRTPTAAPPRAGGAGRLREQEDKGEHYETGHSWHG